MKVIIAHDYLTQRGGAERVVLHLAAAFPGSTVLTSVYDRRRTYPEFGELDIRTFGLDHLPPVRRDPRLGLPVMADLFRRHVVDADLLLCSSSGFAHLLRSTGPKVVYCHNPPRWLHQWEDYSVQLSPPARVAMGVLRQHLTTLDLRGAREASLYLANSANVAGRIHSAYGTTASVIHPPRGLEPQGPMTPVAGLEPGYALTVGRPRGYKRTGLLVSAVAGMPDVTLVTVGNHPDPQLPSNVHQLVNLSDSQLRWLYANAGCLLACSHEDFGLTPVEAFGFGVPVGTTAEGGYLETCVEGLTGVWLDTSSTESLRASIRTLLAGTWDREAIRSHGERWTRLVFQQQIVAAVEPVLRAAAVRDPQLRAHRSLLRARVV